MINHMPVVYVAGPFSGKTSWDVEENVRRAERLGLEVARRGCSPMIPHTNTRFFNGEQSYEFWIAATLALLNKCDAIVLTPDWYRSSGATKEFRFALESGKPAFLAHQLEALAAWATGNERPGQVMSGNQALQIYQSGVQRRREELAPVEPVRETE